MKTNIFEKNRKRAAVFLAGVVVCSMLPAVSAGAKTPNTPKEEVIYTNLNVDGSVKEINAVNIFDLKGDGRIVDYGQYQSLRNMTTTDPISYSGDTVTIDAKAGKLYYEGKLGKTELPWKIRIRYYMNGREFSAEEIAGKSGALKIRMEIAENAASRGFFFENYALQASLTLDTEHCKNITAKDATEANVGSDKQLTYTILPGKGIDTEITADVTDFEMEGISINGLPLNLNVEVDDAELIQRVAELQDAIAKADDGADALRDGTGELKNGGTDMQSGAKELRDGAKELDTGIQSLNKGVGEVQTALDTLNKQSPTLKNGSAAFQTALIQLQTALGGLSVTAQDLKDLTDASSQIASGIDNLADGASELQAGVSSEAYKAVMEQYGLDIEDLQKKNKTVAAAVQDQIKILAGQIAELKRNGQDTQVQQEQMTLLQNIAALLGADINAIDGAGSYLDAANQKIAALASGAAALQSSYTEFDSVIQELVDTLGELPVKMAELSGAVNALVSEYEKLDDGITSYTDGVAQIVAGYSKIAAGSAELVSGSSTLKKGTDRLYNGANDLLSGIDRTQTGAGTLKDGMADLQEETGGMDTEITDRIDDMLTAVTGGDAKTVSFVSDKNTNIESVQFVFRTEGISAPVEDVLAPQEKTVLNFWQKLLKLFRRD